MRAENQEGADMFVEEERWYRGFAIELVDGQYYIEAFDSWHISMFEAEAKIDNFYGSFRLTNVGGAMNA